MVLARPKPTILLNLLQVLVLLCFAYAAQAGMVLRAAQRERKIDAFASREAVRKQLRCGPEPSHPWRIGLLRHRGILSKLRA